MVPDNQRAARLDAIGRAERFSPFLRDALVARPEVGKMFATQGANAAAELALERTDEGLDHELRQQRHGLALATALGGLFGGLPPERGTFLLSHFAHAALPPSLLAAIPPAGA